MLSSNMLLLILILLIDVTFSTPTPDYINNLFLDRRFRWKFITRDGYIFGINATRLFGYDVKQDCRDCSRYPPC